MAKKKLKSETAPQKMRRNINNRDIEPAGRGRRSADYEYGIMVRGKFVPETPKEQPFSADAIVKAHRQAEPKEAPAAPAKESAPEPVDFTTDSSPDGYVATSVVPAKMTMPVSNPGHNFQVTNVNGELQINGVAISPLHSEIAAMIEKRAAVMANSIVEAFKRRLRDQLVGLEGHATDLIKEVDNFNAQR